MARLRLDRESDGRRAFDEKLVDKRTRDQQSPSDSDGRKLSRLHPVVCKRSPNAEKTRGFKHGVNNAVVRHGLFLSLRDRNTGYMCDAVLIPQLPNGDFVQKADVWLTLWNISHTILARKSLTPRSHIGDILFNIVKQNRA
ncbi:MAG TPA: hypothetical protein VG328_05450 [Stellaceae bacterium]|nr:hypothetical protein [Stellaceae bacterium]